MNIGTCAHCKTRVIATDDATCPACRKPFKEASSEDLSTSDSDYPAVSPQSDANRLSPMFAGLLCFLIIFLPIVVPSGFSLYESWQERFDFVESQCSFVRGEVKTIRSRQTEDVSQENVQYQLRLDVMVHTQEKNQIATGIHNNKTYHSYDDAFNALDTYKKSHDTIPCWHEPGNFVDIKIVRNSFWKIIMQLLTIFVFAPLFAAFLFFVYQAPSSEA